MESKDLELYCFDCIYWDSDSPELGYCTHERTEDFQVYAENSAKAGASINAADCPGFEEPVFIFPPQGGDRDD